MRAGTAEWVLIQLPKPQSWRSIANRLVLSDSRNSCNLNSLVLTHHRRRGGYVDNNLNSDRSSATSQISENLLHVFKQWDVTKDGV